MFPGLANHMLLVSLVGLAILTAVNMFGITESAKLLIGPTFVFVVAILAMIALGFVRPHVQAVIGTRETPTITASLGIILILKAFASGCSAVTGVEAIANGVPAFRKPRARTAQRTEILLGILLGVMLVGIALLIHAHHVEPRGGVTVLAQVSAASFGTGWAFYVTNIAVALVLGLAANTSFGGLPVLMSLLAKDHRLPHVFYLRAEKPVYRIGIVALALLSLVLLVASGRAGQQPDPAVRDRRVHRLHAQPGGARPPLARRAAAALAAAGDDQRDRRGDDRDRGARAAVLEVPRGRVGRGHRRCRR